jgi:hypothetical protein
MRAWLRRLQALLLATMLALVAGTAGAHEMSMAEMSLREVTRGDFAWQWTATSDRTCVMTLRPA